MLVFAGSRLIIAVCIRSFAPKPLRQHLSARCALTPCCRKQASDRNGCMHAPRPQKSPPNGGPIVLCKATKHSFEKCDYSAEAQTAVWVPRFENVSTANLSHSTVASKSFSIFVSPAVISHFLTSVVFSPHFSVSFFRRLNQLLYRYKSKQLYHRH